MTRTSILAAIPLMLLISQGHSEPAVLVEAENDTVIKFKYTGGSPTSNHPAVSVEGKRLGLNVKANNSINAIAITGSIDGHTLPSPGSGTAGVIGAGEYGVMGHGSVGVHGDGSGTGVMGITSSSSGSVSAVLGTSSTGNAIGVTGTSTGWVGVYGTTVGGYGVYGSSSGSGFAGFFVGDVVATGTVTGSDAVFKENVRPLDRGLSAVMALRPKAYEIKPGVMRAKTDGTRFGLIAQDLQTSLPEVVHNVKTPHMRDSAGVSDMNGVGAEFLAVRYTELIPVLIKAIQEQQAQIEALEAKRK